VVQHQLRGQGDRFPCTDGDHGAGHHLAHRVGFQNADDQR
jgi:hypothetical protein